MGLRWMDVTLPFHPEMTVWPGDPAFDLAPLHRIREGGTCNTSRIALCTHNGTHIDAPWHFEEDGARVDELDPALFFGRAEIREVACGETISPGDLGERSLPSRLLLKTRNSGFSGSGAFREDYAALSAAAAQRLVDEGVRVVGVDYLSVAPFKQDGQETHHILLSRGVLAVEGLRLGAVPAGPCEFVVLPMLLAGADGAPCRAFVGLGARPDPRTPGGVLWRARSTRASGDYGNTRLLSHADTRWVSVVSGPIARLSLSRASRRS